MEHRLQEPFTKEQVKHFKAGDRVLVTGTIVYSAGRRAQTDRGAFAEGRRASV